MANLNGLLIGYMSLTLAIYRVLSVFSPGQEYLFLFSLKDFQLALQQNIICPNSLGQLQDKK